MLGFPLRISLPKSQEQASLPSPNVDPEVALAALGTASIRGALKAQAKPVRDSGGSAGAAGQGTQLLVETVRGLSSERLNLEGQKPHPSPQGEPETDQHTETLRPCTMQ